MDVAVKAKHERLVALGESIAEHAAHLDAATHRLLSDIRAFDLEGGWYHQGARSCAQWLSWRLGWGTQRAREHVRVANKLPDLPAIDEALRRGELSYCKVRAMTRVATPANEATLLVFARHSTGWQLEAICRKYATVQRHDREPRPKDDEESRHVRRWDTADGMVKIVATLHPEEAAVVWAALEKLAKERCMERDLTAALKPEGPSSSATREAAFDAHPTEHGAHDARGEEDDEHEGHEERAEHQEHEEHEEHEEHDEHDEHEEHEGREVHGGYTAHDERRTWSEPGDLVRNGRAAQSDPDVDAMDAMDEPYDDLRVRRAPAPPPSARPAFDRADALVRMAEEVLRGQSKRRSPVELVVSVSAETLAAAAALPPVLRGGELPASADATQVGTFADGTCVSPHAVRRLACDCGVILSVDDEHGTPLAVGRKHRMIPGSMKRALVRRDQTCRFPGCRNRVFLEGHHVAHWADGGETSLDNLVSLCSHHHRFVHEYGYRIERAERDAWRFWNPYGVEVKAVPPPSTPPRLGFETIRARNADLAITADTPALGWEGDRPNYVWCIDDLVIADERAN